MVISREIARSAEIGTIGSSISWLPTATRYLPSTTSPMGPNRTDDHLRDPAA
jgi:hypothetical protein